MSEATDFAVGTTVRLKNYSPPIFGTVVSTGDDLVNVHWETGARTSERPTDLNEWGA